MRALVAAIVALLAGGGAVARAQTPVDEATPYCEGSGGPAGMATDAEHDVLLGDSPLPSGMRSRRVTVGGVATRVQEAGPPGAGDAVVHVHGHPGSSRDWDDLVAATGRFARSMAFDVPGYGQSDDRARQVQSTEGAATYLQGLLEALGIRRAVLVLHDFGGIWGLHWASRHPRALTGAVLLNTGVLIDYRPHPAAFAWFTPGVGEAAMASTTRESFRRDVQQGQRRPLPAAFVDRMYDDYDRATRCAALRYYRSGRDQGLFGGEADPRRHARVLRRRPRPALVVWGARDPYVPVAYAERQRQAFPEARVEVLPDAAHWPFVDEPARVRSLATGFLRPRLRVPRTLRAGRLRLWVPVTIRGALPAHRVRARILRRGGRTVTATRRPVTVRGRRTLVLPLRRPLRPGRYTVVVRGLGVRPVRVPVRPGPS